MLPIGVKLQGIRRTGQSKILDRLSKTVYLIKVKSQVIE